MSDELEVLLDVTRRLEEVQEAIARERMFNIIHVEKVMKVDLVVKLFWSKDTGSELQMTDVRHLVADVSGLDWAYLERGRTCWAWPLSSRVCDERHHASR